MSGPRKGGGKKGEWGELGNGRGSGEVAVRRIKLLEVKKRRWKWMEGRWRKQGMADLSWLLFVKK